MKTAIAFNPGKIYLSSGHVLSINEGDEFENYGWTAPVQESMRTWGYGRWKRLLINTAPAGEPQAFAYLRPDQAQEIFGEEAPAE